MRLCAGIMGVAAFGQTAPDPRDIMTRAAENMATARDARRQYVYHQRVRASLVRSNGQMARREKREYIVTPTEDATEKKLTLLEGEYFQGKQVIPYSVEGFKHKGMDIDGSLIKT